MPGILVARLDNIGDVLLTGPAVRAVAAAPPAERGPVVFLCGPRGRRGAELLPGVDEVLEWRAPWIEPDPMPVERAAADDLVAAVAARGIDRALVLGSSHQSPLPLALLLRHAGVGRIAAVSHDHAGSLLDARIKGDPDVHEVERNLAVAEALGFPRPADDRLLVDLTGPGDPAPGPGGPEDRHRPYVSGRPAPFAVVHPGASAPARTLSPPRWRAAAKALVADGFRVGVVAGPEETVLTAAVAGEEPGVLDLGGTTTLRGLGRLVASADVFVGGNSGPAHLAAAVGTPCVTVFPPTVPLSRWHPWRVPFVALGDQGVACAGCRARRCPHASQLCVDGVGPAEIVRAARSLLRGTSRPSGSRIRATHPPGC
jgi:ADP-heptose:LPS heptosyltransferase